MQQNKNSLRPPSIWEQLPIKNNVSIFSILAVAVNKSLRLRALYHRINRKRRKVRAKSRLEPSRVFSDWSNNISLYCPLLNFCKLREGSPRNLAVTTYATFPSHLCAIFRKLNIASNTINRNGNTTESNTTTTNLPPRDPLNSRQIFFPRCSG